MRPIVEQDIKAAFLLAPAGPWHGLAGAAAFGACRDRVLDVVGVAVCRREFDAADSAEPTDEQPKGDTAAGTPSPALGDEGVETVLVLGLRADSQGDERVCACLHRQEPVHGCPQGSGEVAQPHTERRPEEPEGVAQPAAPGEDDAVTRITGQDRGPFLPDV